MNVKLSGNRDKVGLQRIPDYTGVGLEGFYCTTYVNSINFVCNGTSEA